LRDLLPLAVPLAIAKLSTKTRANSHQSQLELSEVPCEPKFAAMTFLAPDGRRAVVPMSRKAPFGIVVGLTTLAIVAAVPTAAAGDKGKKHLTILPPAEAPAERLPAHPRVTVEVAPLSGTVPSASTATDPAPPHADPISAHACAGSKVPRAECAQLAARIGQFMNERRPRIAADASSAAALCREGREPASRCAAFLAQITAWLKTRQTAEAAPSPALAGSTTNDR
jgi:hypothetical protein